MSILLTPLTSLLLGLLGALCVALFVWGLHLATRGSEVAGSFVAAPPKRKSDGTFVLHRITELIGRPFGSIVLDWLGEDGQARVQARIDAAGRPDGLTVRRYAQRKAGEVLLYGGLAVLLFLNGSPMLAVVVLAFASLTDLSLYSAQRRRQDEIQRQLPDFLDVLAVTVGAGLAFRQALARVADSMPGVLASEFQLALRQMELGTSRREAFAALRERNSNEALGKFITALQQSEDLGAPLVQTLHAISADMRREDAQFLRRRAQKLNPQVTVVTAATMLPGLLLIIGGGLFLGSGIDLSAIFG
ncbi:type II secretion system F family protein [Thermobifida cellulosilytica]|uniref:Type II secretion system (T2SS), F family protein n=1 Tax=Thermobifida cellulosilytica TB100 TaxID=665004 RepID=A0A147KEX7_THECS|nr:type II secretion system F family protein [Thermobifida cellulosilytica]KUP95843.1 type II secretion system (T2SS), F family protein [Thermobifida cellulosilytica TB100]